VVSAKLFGDIVRKLPNEEIYFEMTEKGTVSIKTAKSEFKIVGFPAEEFPNIGEIENVSSQLSFDKEILKKMIKRTSFSASIDESKGIIVGVLLEIEENSFNMIALDGFRMAVAREKMKSEEKKKIIIAAKILNDINKILSETEEDEEIKVVLSTKKAIILLERTKIVIRLMEGEFILAKEGKNNLIKCSVKENLLTINSSSEEGTVKEDIIMEKEGENIEIGFNSKYLMDALKEIEDEKVKMEFKTGTTPCLLKPIEGEEYEYLILPVRISGDF